MLIFLPVELQFKEDILFYKNKTFTYLTPGFFLFYMYECFDCMYVCVADRVQETESEPLELKLRTILSYHMGPGNRTLAELPLQPKWMSLYFVKIILKWVWC